MISFIFFILVFAVFLCFIIFNLGNTCDVSLGFRTFHDIPVFVTALFSYALGMLFVLPLIFTVGRKRKQKAVKAQAENPQIEGAQTENLRASGSRITDSKLPPPKKKLFGRKSSKKPDSASDEDKIKKENSPYGID
jgi:uncharacterized integral membrane protein